MTQRNLLVNKIFTDIKEDFTNEEKNRLNFLIYSLHRLNDGRVIFGEKKLILLVREFTNLSIKKN